MTEPAAKDEDPLAALRGHLRDAQQAAQRLLHQSEQTPPSGWDSQEQQHADSHAQELHSLSESVRALRDLLPEDLLAQLAELIRQLLEVLQALAEVLLSRLVSQRSAPGEEVQDIPIL